MTEQLKKQSMIYGVGVVIYLAAVIVTSNFTIEDEIKFVWFLIAYLIVGFDVFKKLRDRILELKFLTEYTLTTVATIGAFGIGRYTEGVLVMILFELGVIFEAYSTDNAKRSIEEMIDIRPAFAIRKTDGGEEQIDPIDLQVGDIIVIKPGERVPVDGIVEAGSTLLDMKAVTGESMPRRVSEGNKIYSGCINLSGAVEAKVLKVYRDSTVAQIMELVEEAQNKESESESFVSRFSRIYTPAMVLLALFVMIYPPLTFSYHNWNIWIYRGLIFLIVACPTALVMSIPIAFLGGIASAARQGIVIKGANYLEDLSKADTFVFDKTGTLTKAQPTVVDVVSFNGDSKENLLRLAACMEEHFPHSMAKAVVDAAKRRSLYHEEMHSKVEYIVAHGISSYIEGKKTIIGSSHFVFEDEKCRIRPEYQERFDTLPEEYSHLFLAIDGELVAVICIEDPLREEAGEMVRFLKEEGVSKIVMMTGDSERTAASIAKRVGVDEYYSEVLPEDKAGFIEREKAAGRKVVMIGDGINDSPALSAADAGIAISDGAELAREIADITIAAEDLREIVVLKRLSNAMMHRIQGNYRGIVGINAMLIALGVAGIIQPTTSALLHNTSTLAISLKSMGNLLPTN